MFHRSTWMALALVLALALLSFWIPIANAAPPSNDDISGAIAITSLPFTDQQATSEATVAPNDPYPFCGSGRVATVWYAITLPGDTRVEISTAGSSYSTSISVYTGPPDMPTALPYCGVDKMRFIASPGTTYYILISALVDPYMAPDLSGGLFVSAQQAPPAENDNFATATPIGSIPFNGTADTTGTTLETNENSTPCYSWSPLTGSVWYSFTPTDSQVYLLEFPSYATPSLVVYQGSSLPDLQLVACSAYYPYEVGFQAVAGTPYYFQVGGLYDQQWLLPFTLDRAPPPTVSIYLYPSDPSIFDQVQFYDQTRDRAGQPIQSKVWTFSDGTTATGDYATHRYAVDGDYSAKLTVTTADGRVGSAIQTILVRTHDVAVTKLVAPSSGQTGKSARITASVLDKRYPESVTVELQKSDPSYFTGFVTVSSQTKLMPGRNKTQSFSFDYTFTASDAAMGKVTFRVVAALPFPLRDALIADNTLVAPPTSVKR